MDVEAIGLHERDRDAIGADCGARELARQRPGESDGRRAGGGRDEQARLADAAGVAHEVHDGARAPRGHTADDRVRDEQRAFHGDVDLRCPVLRPRLEEQFALRRRRIVDEHVDRPQLALDPIDGGDHIRLEAQIGADGERLDAKRLRLMGGALRPVGGRMVVERDVGVLGGERQADGAAENHLAGQPEVHLSGILSVARAGFVL